MSTAKAFATSRAEGRAALVGYLPAGFPTVDRGIEAMTAMTSGTVNSGTAASVQVKTPEVDIRTAPCLLWTQAFVSIRWSDNRLSSVSFEMPVGYYNLDAHC